MSQVKLCVNIDHIATVREARGGIEPDPLIGATICEDSGAHGITVHLREDRRHIIDDDVVKLKDIVKGKYNLEMALSDDIIGIAKSVVPDQITLVPEKREELTTEGGLDVKGNFDRIKQVIKEFHDLGIIMSLFIEPDKDVVNMSREVGADYIEIHTGTYCNSRSEPEINREINRIYDAAALACDIGIGVNAGHGLNYENTPMILKTPGLDELNIGHSIISRSIFVGLSAAVKEMVEIIK
ncbi:pyridoxine 5'-phosphate synthase [Spirochaetota bacterium]